MKDEGGRMKDEVKRSFHPSSFRLHPFLVYNLRVGLKTVEGDRGDRDR
jgi:hypothetical protein